MNELKIVADNTDVSLTIEGLCGQERYTYADGTVIQMDGDVPILIKKGESCEVPKDPQQRTMD